MSLVPTTEFVSRGDAHLAYQVFGTGPPDVLEINGYASHRESLWEWPVMVRGQERLAQLARMAQYDMRGYGMSDVLPVGGYPIEELGADALAVADAAGFSQPVFWGGGPGGAVAIWIALHYPERVAGLLLDNATACLRARPGYDIGLTDAQVDATRASFQSGWGTGVSVDLLGSNIARDERVRAEWARYERIAATPSSFLAAVDVFMALDVRDLLSAVAVPTLVLHSATNTAIPASHGRYLAAHIPGARYLEVDADVLRELDAEGVGGDISEFLTGSRAGAHVERSLLVVVFTDIVDSTERLAAMGDIQWRDLLDDFRRTVRSILGRYDAHEVNTRGDDFFAVVSRPSIAVSIARAIRSEAANLGVAVRTGIHLGEVEHQGNDYTGLAVHIGARIATLAAPGEILMSQTVRDALVGSTVESTSRGNHHLKGVPHEWQIFSIEN